MSLGLISSYKGKKSSGKFIQRFAIKSIATAGNVLVDLFSVTKINLFSSFSHDTQVPGRFSAVDTELKKNRNDMDRRHIRGPLWLLHFLFLFTLAVLYNWLSMWAGAHPLPQLQNTTRPHHTQLLIYLLSSLE